MKLSVVPAGYSWLYMHVFLHHKMVWLKRKVSCKREVGAIQRVGVVAS
jgi:hypothetical protein